MDWIRNIDTASSPTWQQCPCTQDLTVATTRVGGMISSGSAAVESVTSAWYSDDQNSAVPGVQFSDYDINDRYTQYSDIRGRA